jgi:prophage antirepressor-like protein
METSIKLFTYENKQVRTFEREGHVWFVLKDVEAITTHKSIRGAKKVLRPFEVDEVAISDVTGRKQFMSIITESGLYRLILNSRLPEAIRFSDYVCCEILPQIRKTGSYNSNSKQHQEVVNDKHEVQVLTDQKNRINKRLRYLKERIEENENIIYSPYKATCPALQHEFAQQKILFD